jgi:ssRNA-specific RNase YbeY (16S rRNA maturation enzyme)
VLLLRHPSLDNEQLLLGDVVISVETAARQAEERGHTLVDEFRILLVNFSHL